MELLWDGGTKVCSNVPGHMTKMAAMPIYIVKTLKNLLLWNQKANDLETWYATLGARVLPNLLKRLPELTLTYFTARSNLSFMLSYGKKVK